MLRRWFPPTVLVLVSLLFVSNVPVSGQTATQPAGPTVDHAAEGLIPGTAMAWGYNGVGELGDGSSEERLVPTPVSGLSDVQTITAGFRHSLAITSNGDLWSWGHNDYGQLGDGSTTDRHTPVRVNALRSVIAVAAGEKMSYAVTSDGTVWSWGTSWESNGERWLAPRPLALTNIRAITAGENHALALKSDGTVWTWGDNYWGQLGDGSTWPCGICGTAAPKQVSELSGIVAVAAGATHSLALTQDGRVWGWGNNYDGEAGVNDPANDQSVPSPRLINSLSGIVVIAADGRHSLALTSDGQVYAWGLNYGGQLGNPAVGKYGAHPEPVPVTGLTEVVKIAAGGGFSLAIRSDGTLWGWGQNRSGELGDGSKTDRLSPVRVPNLDHVRAIDGGSFFSLAIVGGTNTSASTSTSTTATTAPGTTGRRYVALGDSIPYGHGLANPDQTEWHDGLPPNEGPAQEAYPKLLSRDLRLELYVRPEGCVLGGDNLAISGATSTPANSHGEASRCSRAVYPDEIAAAQMRNRPPSIVSIQVGADDINFAGCLLYELAGNLPALAFMHPEKCIDGPPGSRQPTAKVQAELARLASTLEAIVRVTSAQAPRAKILLLNYFQIIPGPEAALFDDGSIVCRAILERGFVFPNYRLRLYDDAVLLQHRLNDVIMKVAQAHPEIVFVNIANVFVGREMCTAQSGSVGKARLFTGAWRAAHPTALGQQEIAEAVKTACRTRSCVRRVG